MKKSIWIMAIVAIMSSGLTGCNLINSPIGVVKAETKFLLSYLNGTSEFILVYQGEEINPRVEGLRLDKTGGYSSSGRKNIIEISNCFCKYDTEKEISFVYIKLMGDLIPDQSVTLQVNGFETISGAPIKGMSLDFFVGEGTGKPHILKFSNAIALDDKTFSLSFYGRMEKPIKDNFRIIDLTMKKEIAEAVWVESSFEEASGTSCVVLRTTEINPKFKNGFFIEISGLEEFFSGEILPSFFFYMENPEPSEAVRKILKELPKGVIFGIPSKTFN